MHSTYQIFHTTFAAHFHCANRVFSIEYLQQRDKNPINSPFTCEMISFATFFLRPFQFLSPLFSTNSVNDVSLSERIRSCRFRERDYEYKFQSVSSAISIWARRPEKEATSLRVLADAATLCYHYVCRMAESAAMNRLGHSRDEYWECTA